MEKTALRIRDGEAADRSVARPAGGRILWGLIAFLGPLSILSPLGADIPWPEVTKRLTEENEKLASRLGGHNGEYFVVCTLYYTPVESGFTTERGFDVTPETRPGLRGNKYPREFLQAVKKEGFGRITTPIAGCNYIRYEDGNTYGFAKQVTGRGGELVARSSAAAHRGKRALGTNVELITTDETVRAVFGSANWKIVDTGGGLRHWQIDLYWGEDEPLGPGKLLARPRGTEFEYAYSQIRTTKAPKP